MLKKKIFRGYIFSRRIEDSIIPQRVQNLVIKDYCERNNLFFKLSATEYKMDNCYLMLKSVLKNIQSINGIVFYSMFMLPNLKKDRLEIFKLIIKKKKMIRFALEEIVLKDKSNIDDIENLYLIKKNS
tara:strand:+ start:370 stop:753 length:384 start_codon:yes stop_codon:yes gene_type:complete